MSDDRKLEIIRGLLANAEDEGNTAEARESYLAKATTLMAKYGVDRALLAATGEQPDEVGDRIITCEAPYALDKAILLWRIAEPLRVRSVRYNQSLPNGAKRVHLFGMESDLDRLEILFTSLLIQAITGMADLSRMSYYDSPVSYRKAWLAGFAAKVGDRLKEAERRATEEHQATEGNGSGPSLALVLVSRKDRVDRRVESVFPKLNSGRKRRLNSNGWGQGQAAGQRADLGGTRVTTGTGARRIGR